MDSFHAAMASSNSSASVVSTTTCLSESRTRRRTEVVVGYAEVEQAARGTLDINAAFVRCLGVHM